MTSTTQAGGGNTGFSANGIRNLMRDRPIIPLLVLLGVLVLVL